MEVRADQVVLRPAEQPRRGGVREGRAPVAVDAADALADRLEHDLVAARQLADRRLALDLAGHVLGGADHARGLTGAVRDDLAARPDGADRAVRPRYPVGERERAALGDRLAHGGPQTLLLVREDRIDGGLEGDGLRERRARRRCGTAPRSSPPPDSKVPRPAADPADPLRLGEQGSALEQRVALAAALGDVDRDAADRVGPAALVDQRDLGGAEVPRLAVDGHLDLGGHRLEPLEQPRIVLDVPGRQDGVDVVRRPGAERGLDGRAAGLGERLVDERVPAGEVLDEHERGDRVEDRSHPGFALAQCVLRPALLRDVLQLAEEVARCVPSPSRTRTTRLVVHTSRPSGTARSSAEWAAMAPERRSVSPRSASARSSGWMSSARIVLTSSRSVRSSRLHSAAFTST